MELIKTTRTYVEKMAAEAKALRQSEGLRLMQCQDLVAVKHGYHHWNHVQICLKATSEPSFSPQAKDPHSLLLDTYFEFLDGLATSPVQVNQAKQDVFWDVSVEGVRFKGTVSTDPFISRKDEPYDAVPFGVALIYDLEPSPDEPLSGYHICKYDPTQPCVSLTGLSQGGIAAVAKSFGLIMQPPESSSEKVVRDWFELVNSSILPAYAFFRSPAGIALRSWCRAHPKLAKKHISKTDYLLYWHRFIDTEWPAPETIESIDFP